MTAAVCRRVCREDLLLLEGVEEGLGRGGPVVAPLPALLVVLQGLLRLGEAARVVLGPGGVGRDLLVLLQVVGGGPAVAGAGAAGVVGVAVGVTHAVPARAPDAALAGALLAGAPAGGLLLHERLAHADHAHGDLVTDEILGHHVVLAELHLGVEEGGDVHLLNLRRLHDAGRQAPGQGEARPAHPSGLTVVGVVAHHLLHEVEVLHPVLVRTEARTLALHEGEHRAPGVDAHDRGLEGGGLRIGAHGGRRRHGRRRCGGRRLGCLGGRRHGERRGREVGRRGSRHRGGRGGSLGLDRGGLVLLGLVLGAGDQHEAGQKGDQGHRVLLHRSFSFRGFSR